MRMIQWRRCRDARRKATLRLQLEALEDRLAPATHTWTGAATSGAFWSDPNNWQGGAPSTTETNVVLIFPDQAAQQTNTNNITGLTIQSIAFLATSLTTTTNYSITGNAITLSGGITQAGPTQVVGTDTLNPSITLSAAQKFSVANTNGTLVLGGMLSGPGAVTKDGAGTVVLSGANAGRTGTTTLTAGLLIVGGNTALGTNTLVFNGGALASSTAVTLANPFTGSGTVGGSNSLTMTGGGTLNGPLTVNNSAGTITLSGNISGASGSLAKSGAGTLMLGGTNAYAGGTTLASGILTVGTSTALGMSSGTLTLNGGTLQASAVVTLANPFTVGGAATLDGSNNFTLSGPSTLAAGKTLTVSITAPTTLTLSGLLSGGGGLIKSGTGTLVLSHANNNYTGATTISAGILQQGAGAFNAVPSGSAVTVAGGATFNLNNLVDTIGSLAGAGSVILGSGTLTAGGDNSSTTFSGVIGPGTGGLTKTGTGTLTLSRANTYTGSTVTNNGTLLLTVANTLASTTVVIGFGTLRLGVANSLPNTTAVTVNNNGSTFDLNNFSTTIGSLAGVGMGRVLLGSGNLTVGGINTSTTFSGVIGPGTGSLIKVGNGTLTLLGSNTYTGGTMISAGILSAGNNTALGSGALTFNGGTLQSTGTFTLSNSYTVANPGGTISGSNNLTLSGSGTLNARLTASNSAGTISLSGNLTGSSGLTINNAGILLLSGNNNYAGGTLLHGGLTIGSNTALGTGALDVTGFSTLQSSGTFSLANAYTVESNTGLNIVGGTNLTLSGPGTLNSGLSVANTAGTITLSGNLGGTAGIFKDGPGELVLSGNNNYGGGTNLAHGTLTAGSNTALGSGMLVVTDGTLQSNTAVTLTNPYTIDNTEGGGTPTIGGANNLTLSGPGTFRASLTVNHSAGVITLSGPVSGDGGLFMSGTGELRLLGNNTYTGDTFLFSGVLTAGSNTAFGTGTLFLDGGVLQATSAVALTNPYTVESFATGTIGGSNNLTLQGPGTLNNTLSINNTAGVITLSGALGGTGSINKLGVGELVLSGNNTYSGGTTLGAGILTVGGNTALGVGSLSLATATLQASGAVALANPYTVTNNSTAALGGNNNLTLSGAGIVNGTLSVSRPAGVVTLSGNLSGPGRVQTLVGNSGELVLSGNNNYTGGTLVNGGVLTVGSNTAAGTGMLALMNGTVQANTAVILTVPYTVGPNGPLGSTLGGQNDLILSGAGILNDSLQVNNAAGTITLSGNVSGSGGITKAGAGTLVLSGNDTYTGSTTVNAGTLLVNGQVSTSGTTNNSVAVNSGGTLGGSGTVSGPAGIVANSGGIISPGGSSPGILTADVAKLNTGSVLRIRLNGSTAGSGYDQLKVNSPANLTNSPNLSVSAGFTAAPGNTFTILQGVTGLTGAFNGLPNNATLTVNGQMFQINYTASSVVLIRNLFPTTTALSASANPSIFGQPVTFTATVTPTPPATGIPTGTVTFTIDGVANPTGVPLSVGQATFNTATLGVGNHTITAAYSGDGNYNLSTSAALTQTVNRANTATVVITSTNPSVFGQPVTFTALVVSPVPAATGTPTGTVTFQEGSTVLATVPLNASGQASFVTPTLRVGSHTITATYGGDVNFNPSTAGPLTQSVNRADVTASLTSSANPSVLGQTVTFTATLTATSPGSGTPTGTITFTVDGTAQTPAVSIANGQATFSIATLGPGNHTITAAYSGDSNFNTASPVALTQTVTAVTKAATSTAITSSVNPSILGQAVNFKATVSTGTAGVGTPSGTITFSVDGAPQPSVPLGSDGTATLSTTTLAVGTHFIGASYSGDSTFNTSTSAPLTQTVNKASTATLLASSANPSNFGQPVTLFARVSAASAGPGTPTGTVTFQEGATVLGTSSLGAGGLATFTTSTPLAAGTHTLTAVYGGDATFATSTSSPLLQTVNPGTDTATVLTSSANPSALGQTITLTATVTGVIPGAGTPTGSVTFQDGTTTLGSAPLNGTGRAALATGSLTGGPHTLTAVYGGDGTFHASSSPVLIQTVSCDPNQAFVTALYLNVLQRAPDSIGFTFWVGRLNAGLARVDVASGFETSAEHRGLEVDQFYRTLLHRLADSAGRSFFVSLLTAGHSEAEVVAVLVSSQEYFTLNSGTNAGFVQALYRDILNRAAGAAEVAIWLTPLQLNAANRPAVALALLTSQEALLDAIDDNYREILRRTAGAQERQLWLNFLLSNRGTPADLTAAFLASDEFLAQAIKACQ
jgi:autotransporter-associated beta strand protein/adhesin HecA-like repeat protein